MRRRLLLLAASALVCLALSEVVCRVYWSAAHAVPSGNPGLVLYAFYPELEQLEDARPRHDDETYDVLLLGGSVLNAEVSTVERELLEQLALAGHRNVRVFNLAKSGHSSRDSRLKYAALGDERFELVILYHGINEARANNVPARFFRDDYGHYSWYEAVNALARYHGARTLALFPTVRYLGVRTRQLVLADRYVPTHAPRPEWVQHGSTVRTARAFEQNLNAVLDLASQRGDRILLMTFALHLPDDYSHEAFSAKRLDYLLHRYPIALWGEAGNVSAAVDAHNEVVRRLAAGRPDVLFVDQASSMTRDGRRFHDPCHLTIAGASEFVRYALGVVLPTM